MRRAELDEPSLGQMLKQWRGARRLSQLDLAHRADISARHLSFVETGRSKPSREMVLLLAAALDVPLRERNAMLLSAGFAPMFAESSLDASAVATARSALDAILRQQEPYPAIVLDRSWNIVTGNHAAREFFAYLMGWSQRPATVNVAHLVFDPDGLRSHVQNWRTVASALLQRIRREALGGPGDASAQHLIDQLLGYPDCAHLLRELALEQPTQPVLPVAYVRGAGDPVFQYLSIVSTLGTPQDVTLQELRVESFFPMDAATERHARALVSTTSSPGSGALRRGSATTRT